MFPVKFTDGQSLQALDPNAQTISYAGHGVVSGCDVSINTGTLGSGEATVTVASGTLLVGGGSSDKSSANVALDNADPNHPRKDLVVFDPSIPGFTAITGSAEEAEPTGAIRQDAERPAPPSLSGSVDAISGSGDPVIVLAEAWIPAGASGITSDDLADRRQEVSPEVAAIDIDDRASIPVYSDDTNAPNETLFYNSDKSQTKYKDSSGVVHTTGRTTLYMSDYVAASDRDGSVAVDTEFDAAISDAEPYDTIVFDDGTYQLNSGHVISKSLTIDSSNATLSLTNTSNNNAHIEFQGGGTGNSTSSDAAAERGDRTVSVTDASIFAAEDRVLFMNATYGETTDAKIQFARIESVDTTNNNISLYGGLDVDFASGVNVYVVDLIDSPVMRNLNTEGGGNRHLEFRWCERPRYENVEISQYLEVSLYSLDCWKPRYHNVEATDPEGLNSGEGEPIALYRSTDGYVESPRVYDCRRGIDLAWGSRSHTIEDPVIRGVSLNGISVHSNDTAGKVSISGGEIVCADDGQSGNGITSSDTANFHIDNVRIVARKNGIICNGPTQISDVTIESTEGTSGTHLAGINFQHGDSTAKGVFIDDPDGNFDFPIWLDGSATNMRSIHVECETAHAAKNHVYVDARDGSIENVVVRGVFRNLGAASSQGMLVRASNGYRLDNIDISGKMMGFGNQCIRILAEDTSSGTGAIDNVNVHDSYFDAGKAAVYSDGAGTFETLRVRDSSMDTGSTSLSFNETINKLFITNNDTSGSIDSTGATNKTVSGNL